MKIKYIWNKKTDNEYQLWPNRSREYYITEPFVPMGEINKQSNSPLVLSPPPNTINHLEKHGIQSSAFASHKKGYYQSRAGVDFHFLVYTVSGSAKIKFENQHARLTRGKAFISPIGSSYNLSCETDDWSIIWFHMNSTPLWNRAFGGAQGVFKSEHFSEISKIIEYYANELYSPASSFLLLESYANAISELLKRDFLNGINTPLEEGLGKIVNSMRENPAKNISSSAAARILHTDKRKINEMCLKTWSITFQQLMLQIKMQKALHLLTNTDLSNVKIAEKIGYSDAYVFSRAFKAYYGKSPKNFIRSRKEIS